MKVFFCRFGLKVRLVRRNEKLTLCPCCLPLPVSSHRDAISFVPLLLIKTGQPLTKARPMITYLPLKVKRWYTAFMGIDPFTIALILIIILISMTLHEVMHGAVAYWLGDDTAKAQGRLTLNPIKHIDPFLTLLLPVLLAMAGQPIFGGAKPVPFNPGRLRYDEWGAALVAIAGPLTNLALAFAGYLLLAFVQPIGLIGEAMQLFVLVNLGFFIFNILPIPPLDGSRVLYALAPDGARRFMEVVEQYGILVVFAIVLLFNQQLGQLLGAMLGFFLGLFQAIVGV